MTAQILLAGAFALAAGAASAAERRFFVRGYGEGSLMPEHNEMDLNLRRPDLQAETGGFGDNYARYDLRGQVFAGVTIGNRFVKEAFLFVKPDFVLGRTIPQREYTWSPRFIGWVQDFGAGVSLPGNWLVYIERHKWLFSDKLATTGDGPYGLYHSLTVRKTFNLEF